MQAEVLQPAKEVCHADWGEWVMVIGHQFLLFSTLLGCAKPRVILGLPVSCSGIGGPAAFRWRSYSRCQRPPAPSALCARRHGTCTRPASTAGLAARFWVFGEHDQATVAQMRNCMSVGN